jgi:hypothetical protein
MEPHHLRRDTVSRDLRLRLWARSSMLAIARLIVQYCLHISSDGRAPAHRRRRPRV